ncbi:hypothetical protein ACP70R_010045 [Stipagrostis hirtigluma subsp. patula]
MEKTRRPEEQGEKIVVEVAEPTMSREEMAKRTMSLEQELGIYKYFLEQDFEGKCFREDGPWTPGVMSAKELNAEIRNNTTVITFYFSLG